MVDNILKFPKIYKTLRYGGLYYQFFLSYVENVENLKIELIEDTDEVFSHSINDVNQWGNGFSCTLNDKQFIVDIKDCHLIDYTEHFPGIPYFKYQKSEKSNTQTLPLGPPMCATLGNGSVTKQNMTDYFNLRKSFVYNPEGMILCKQRKLSYKKFCRRPEIQRTISQNFSNYDVSFQKDSSLNFWKKHKGCSASVCVPGYRDTILDRGQLELIGLGVCTISPELDTILCYNQKLIPDVHYIKCKDDYSDLVDKIKMLQSDKKLCKKIGDNARDFFDTYMVPHKYLEWVKKCLR